MTTFIADDATLSELQNEIFACIDFIALMHEAGEKDRVNGVKIKALLQGGNWMNENPWWYVQLTILDIDMLDNKNCKRKGIYRREWCINAENNRLEIEAGTHTTEDNLYAIDKDYFYCWIDFADGKMHGDLSTLQDFKADLFAYQSYLTDTMNLVEPDIEIE